MSRFVLESIILFHEMHQSTPTLESFDKSLTYYLFDIDFEILKTRGTGTFLGHQINESIPHSRDVNNDELVFFCHFVNCRCILSTKLKYFVHRNSDVRGMMSRL